MSKNTPRLKQIFMKQKILFSFVLLFSIFMSKLSFGSCNNITFTHTQVGNVVTFAPSIPVGYVINTVNWTFGDGGNAAIANPTHTYANAGWYNVCMMISGVDANNGIFQCNICDSINVGNMNAPCNASFIYSISGNVVTFTNTATGPGVITGYAWTFGDGGTSVSPNPLHNYAAAGVYTVCLTITGIDNNQTYTCTWCDSMYVPGPGGNPCNGVSYVVSQSGNVATFSPVVPVGYVINTYFWNFGDGGTSNLPNPVHTYANPGSYSPCVTLSGSTANNVLFQCTYCDSLVVGMNAPCNASFIYTTSGLNAAFTNTATGPGAITGYAWTFGDGGTSALTNPTHTYANTGWYNVCLTITGIDNGQTYSCTWCDSVYVQGPIPNPCNGVSYATTQVGNAVTFSAIVPAGYIINTYFWTFGDGGNSNLANPTHTYANPGWYNACLVVSGTTPNNGTFQCTYCDSLNVGNVNQPCNASFIYTTSGLNAVFTNTATGPGAITGYNWTFGDGGTSALPNPTHTYANSGWYNVCLTIIGIDNGQTYTCTWCDSVYVQGPVPNPCNGVSYTTTQAGNAVTFNAVVPAGYVINTYYWTFGDGGNSNLANPTHTYANPGWYNACMVISGTTPNNGVFQCTYCDSIQIGNNVPCNASFIYTVAGNTVNFTNTATGPGPITSYAWTFGDGGTSALANPSHTYVNTGWYNVCLTITGTNNGQTYTCNWCDSIFVQAAANPCNGVYFNHTLSGMTATFNAVVPAGYVVNTYSWTFGDGGTSVAASPSHTYANMGYYNVCMVVSGMANNNTPFQCSVCDSIQVFISGVNDIGVNNTLNVYPNPVSNTLQIDMPEGNHFTLRLFDVAGKLLDEKVINDQAKKYELSTESLSKGMYFIQLVSDKKKYQTNFVRQ